MSIKIFDLYGDVSLKTGDVNRGLDQVKTKAEAVGRKLQQVGQSLTQFGSMMSTRVTLPLVALGTLLVKLGSDAEEVRAKFNTAFRDVRDQADRTATALARDYGLSQTAAERLLSSTGDLLKGFGATGDQAIVLSNRVQELAVDLASYNNVQGGSTTASEILTKAMLGERDALTSLGIKISDADVQQRLLANGQQELIGRARLLAIAETTLALAYEQSGDALGDFARTSDSVANQIRMMKADAEDAAVSFKEALLPAASELIAKGREILQWLTDLDPATKSLIVKIAALAAAMGPLALGIGAVSKALAILTANPLVAGLALIAAGVALIALKMAEAKRDWEDYNNLINNTAEAVKGLTEAEQLGRQADLMERMTRLRIEAAPHISELNRLQREAAAAAIENAEAVRAGYIEQWQAEAAAAEYAREIGTLTEVLKVNTDEQAVLFRAVTEIDAVMEEARVSTEAQTDAIDDQAESVHALSERLLIWKDLQEGNRKLSEEKAEALRRLEVLQNHQADARQEEYDDAAHLADLEERVAARRALLNAERIAGMDEITEAERRAATRTIENLRGVLGIRQESEEEAIDASIDAWDQYYDARIAAAKIAADEETAIDLARFQQQLGYASTFADSVFAIFQNLGELRGEDDRAQAQRAKRFALFEVAINTVVAISEVLLNPVAMVAAAALGAAQALAIATRPIPEFARGGVVPGQQYSGDNVVSRLNSGEMVLTTNMQQNLLNLLSKSQPAFATGADFVVPPGYPADSYGFRAQSGERVQVTPSQNAGGMSGRMVLSIGGRDFDAFLTETFENGRARVAQRAVN